MYSFKLTTTEFIDKSFFHLVHYKQMPSYILPEIMEDSIRCFYMEHNLKECHFLTMILSALPFFCIEIILNDSNVELPLNAFTSNLRVPLLHNIV